MKCPVCRDEVDSDGVHLTPTLPYRCWREFDIKKGDMISFKTLRGKVFTAFVKEVVEDEKTGEIRISTE